MKRAADLLAIAANALPAGEVKKSLQMLIADDRYGTREPLVALAARTPGE